MKLKSILLMSTVSLALSVAALGISSAKADIS